MSRTPSRHQDFQHEGHYDIKYIEKVPESSKSLKLSVAKYIKNPTEDGKSIIIDKEIKKLTKNQFDPTTHHQYYQKHQLKFLHEGGDPNILADNTKSERYGPKSDVWARTPKKSERFFQPSKDVRTKEEFKKAMKEPIKAEVAQSSESPNNKN